jgi:hypothetical protein
VSDGVDLISMSIGGAPEDPFYNDAIAVTTSALSAGACSSSSRAATAVPRRPPCATWRRG